MERIRARLEATAFPDLDSMMLGYAAAAADTARERYRHRLDFTDHSITALEAVLSELAESIPDAANDEAADWDFEVRLWGAYLGEVLRRRYNGAWEMTNYPGGVSAMPAIDIRGSRLFPLMKVYRRLTLGEDESVNTFYQLVTERLGKPAQVN